MQATKPNPGSSIGGNVISGQQIHFARPLDKKPSQAATPKPAESPPPPVHHVPQITLIKDGDTVNAIEVLCTCGEVIRLDCKYGN